MSQVRLYLDEDAMRKALVFGLRARNVDVLAAADANMINRQDEDHLVMASTPKEPCSLQRSRLLRPPSTLDESATRPCRYHRCPAAALLGRRRAPADYAPDQPSYSRTNAEPIRVHLRVGLTVNVE